MSIKKDLERYFEKYNDIPKEYNERFSYILKKLKINEKNMENIIGRIKLQNKIKWKKIQFTLYMVPKATPRPRLGKRGIFYVKNASDLKKYFEEGIEEFYDENYPINKPCKLIIDSFFPIPDNMTKVEKILSELKFIRPISKPDWDNIGKTYSDIIQPSLILDDSLIIESTVRKFYSFKPRVEITIFYMDDFDSEYNMKKINKWKVNEK